MNSVGEFPADHPYWCVVSRPRISLDTSLGGMMLLQGGGHQQTQERAAVPRARRGGSDRASCTDTETVGEVIFLLIQDLGGETAFDAVQIVSPGGTTATSESIRPDVPYTLPGFFGTCDSGDFTAH